MFVGTLKTGHGKRL